MAGASEPGRMSELRSAWGRLRQTASDAWDDAHNTVRFGNNKIPRDVLVRILWSASKLSTNAYEWEMASERRRHSVQLRRLAVLMGNLEALAMFVGGAEVTVSDGDILSIIDQGEGEDTPEQRAAPRADAVVRMAIDLGVPNSGPVFYYDESEKNALKLANVYQEIRKLRREIDGFAPFDGNPGNVVGTVLHGEVAVNRLDAILSLISRDEPIGGQHG